MSILNIDCRQINISIFEFMQLDDGCVHLREALDWANWMKNVTNNFAIENCPANFTFFIESHRIEFQQNSNKLIFITLKQVPDRATGSKRNQSKWITQQSGLQSVGIACLSIWINSHRGGRRFGLRPSWMASPRNHKINALDNRPGERWIWFGGWVILRI